MIWTFANPFRLYLRNLIGAVARLRGDNIGVFVEALDLAQLEDVETTFFTGLRLRVHTYARIILRALTPLINLCVTGKRF